MTEKNEKQKLLDKIFNIRIIAIIAVIGLGVIAFAKFKKSVEEIVPNYKEEYCQKEEMKYSEIFNRISKNSNSQNLNYGQILNLKKDLEKLTQYIRTKKEYNCEKFKEFKENNTVIKDNLLSTVFSMVEVWESNEDKEAKNKVKELCLILIKFDEETDSLTDKELTTVKSTLKLLQK